MKNGLAILDSGPIFSLAAINQLHLLNHFFDEIKIPKAVWEEVILNNQASDLEKIKVFFAIKVHQIEKPNRLLLTMDYGESEAVTLYQEMKANYLLIDDKKARKRAEGFGVNCIGTLGLLISAKSKGLIFELRPLFMMLLQRKRYFSIQLLNQILIEEKEQLITIKT